MSGDAVGRERLAADLRALGLRPGQALLVHCSMKKIGHVTGGPATLLAAITDASGRDATIVVPTMTLLNSFTSSLFLATTAGMTPQQYERFVGGMGFDRSVTPSTRMGALAEHVRTRPEARRSGHPLSSFAALGPAADECTSRHDLECSHGDQSPLGWLYDADAAILLLGVDYSACTAFHLAEYKLPGRRSRPYRCFVIRDGTREPCEFTGIELDDRDFPSLGMAFEAPCQAGPGRGGGAPRRGFVGAADSRLVPMRAAVDFARTWLGAHRTIDSR